MVRLVFFTCALAGALYSADLGAYGKLPLSFSPAADPGAFAVHGSGFSFQLTAQRAALHLPGGTVGMALSGARAGARLAAEAPLPGVVNWLVGADPAQWRQGIPTYARLRATAVLPGVDLVYYGNPQQLEYDLIVAPGANPSKIRWEISGVTGLRLAPDGSLLLATAAGELRWRAPEAYQEKAGRRVAVPSAYRLLRGHRVGFTIGDYDRSLPLIIDPTFDYVYRFGQPGRANAVQVDQFGQAYIAGSTPSGPPSGENAFVAQLDSNGSAMRYFTIFGGFGADRAYGLALENKFDPFLYVTGSYETPTGIDLFLYRFIAASGSNLHQPQITMGGSGTDIGHAVALHPTDGTIYIAGVTDSADLRMVNAAQPVKGTGQDGLLIRLRADRSIVHSTFLGGNGTDSIAALQLDAAGRIWLAGTSTSQDLFAAPATHQPRNAGGADCLVTGLNFEGTARVFSSYLGGPADDGCTGLGLTPGGNIVVGGYTDSPTFPTLNPTQAVHGGARDMFVAEFGPVAGLQFSTFLGGPRRDAAHGLAVDSSGTIHLAGESTGLLPLLNPVAPEKAGSPGVLLRAASPVGMVNQVVAGFGDETELTALTFATGNEVFAAGNSGRLYRSLDGGTTWSILAAAPAGGIHSLASSGTALLAATPLGVYLSLNQGSAWSSVSRGLPADLSRASVRINAESGAFYLAHPTAGFFRSVNNGVSWTAANTGLTNLATLHLTADPLNPSVLYLATAGGVFRSTDAGARWALAGDSRVRTQTVPAPRAGLNYGIDNGRPAVSTDSARTWTARPLPTGDPVLRLAVDPANANHVLAATAATGLWRSLDAGVSWALASPADATALDAVFAPGGNGAVLGLLRLHPDAVVARWGRLAAGANRYNYYQASVSYFGTHLADVGLAVTADANTINTYLAGSAAGSPFVTRFGPSPAACAYESKRLDVLGLSPAEGGAAALSLEAPSGCSWTVTAGAPWLQLHGSGSRTGSGEVRAFTLRNESVANRETTLTVAGKVIPVSQNGTACDTEARLTSTPGWVTESGFLQYAELTIPAGCAWTTEGPSWIQLSPAQGIGSSTIHMSWSFYRDLNPRTAIVRIGSRTLEVTQNGICHLEFLPAELLFSSLGGTAVVSLQTDARCPWTLTDSASAVSFPSSASGMGSGTVTLTLAPNPGPARTVTVSGPYPGTLARRQDGSECNYTVGPTLLQASKDASTLRLPVQTGPTCRRPATSDQPWLQVTGTAETGSGDLLLLLSRNPGATHRTGRVTLGRNIVTVVQGGQPPQAPSVLPPSPASGSGVSQWLTVDVTDLNGDVDVVNVLINSGLDARGGCYLAYVRASNTLYLVPDSGEGLLAGTLSNSQCTVDTAATVINRHDAGVVLGLRLQYSSAFAGNKIVYVAARDQAGHNTGWLPLGVWTVPNNTLSFSDAPQVSSLSPGRVTTAQATLEMTVSDPDGAADLTVLNLLVNHGLDARSACYLAYVVPFNVVYLVPDSGEGLLPAGEAENSQCRVLAPGASATIDNGRLKLRIPLEFKAGPVRNRIVYGAARDGKGNNSGWQALGTVTVP
jgi:hypothetical protein